MWVVSIHFPVGKCLHDKSTARIGTRQHFGCLPSETDENEPKKGMLKGTQDRDALLFLGKRFKDGFVTN